MYNHIFWTHRIVSFMWNSFDIQGQNIDMHALPTVRNLFILFGGPLNFILFKILSLLKKLKQKS